MQWDGIGRGLQAALLVKFPRYASKFKDTAKIMYKKPIFVHFSFALMCFIIRILTGHSVDDDDDHCRLKIMICNA